MAKTAVLPGVGVLVALMFTQQVVFGGLESLLALFNLNRLGMSASSNAVVFVFVGVILVAVQGKYIGPWSRKYGERRLILAGLTLLAAGIALTALTPQVTVPWYSSAELTAELAANAAESSALTGITSVALPPDGFNGWLGIAWLLVAMVPCTIGAGLLAPSINSLISKSVACCGGRRCAGRERVDGQSSERHRAGDRWSDVSGLGRIFTVSGRGGRAGRTAAREYSPAAPSETNPAA